MTSEAPFTVTLTEDRRYNTARLNEFPASKFAAMSVTYHNLEQLDNYVYMQLQQSCYQAIEVKEPAVKKSSRVKKTRKSEG